MGKYGSIEQRPALKWSLNVIISCFTSLRQFIPGGIVGSQCSWTWVIFGRRERLPFPVSYMLAWAPWWVGAHGGPWKLRWTRCLLVTSLGGWICYLCHTHIENIYTCLPYLISVGIFRLGMWLFAACGRWSWWTLCLCVVPEVSSVLLQVYSAILSWWTWDYFVFGACGPWLLPLIGAGAC